MHFLRFSQRVRSLPTLDLPLTASSKLGPQNLLTRKTKIICTIGPACDSVERIVELIDAGMNIARLNMSHGDRDTHRERLYRVREAAKLRPLNPVAIMIDTKGPEIRTGVIPQGPNLDEPPIISTPADHPIVVEGIDHDVFKSCIQSGDIERIVTTPSRMVVSIAGIGEMLSPDDIILCADGSVTLRVTKVLSPTAVATVSFGPCTLRSRMNVAIPGKLVRLPVLLDNDVGDIADLGVGEGAHAVAASFVQSADDCATVRASFPLAPAVASRVLMSKIETVVGARNAASIIANSDCVMVARGDLSMCIGAQRVFLAQKEIIALANAVGVPVTVATQMLESMITRPRPTCAEVNDVANAVLDGADSVMLTGETAGGAYPVEAVKWMASTCVEAERVLDSARATASVHAAQRALSTEETVAAAAVRIAADVRAAAIIVATETGTTARLCAKYRPAVPIYAATPLQSTAYELCFFRGVHPCVAPLHTSVYEYDAARPRDSPLPLATLFGAAARHAVASGAVARGDPVVFVRSMCEGKEQVLRVDAVDSALLE